ncbi:hypothetical protein [Lactococcus protaetiae]|uniref:hypothetical protein n=1 Tax=Lactococcus protaetiae TaxID=2592653 RepID=UPI0016810A72|nr:hypothetical protein [Lactococcus protaetiae]MCL2113822.1 hypothetical protein [Streptococcaceae bacterium]
MSFVTDRLKNLLTKILSAHSDRIFLLTESLSVIFIKAALSPFRCPSTAVIHSL